MACSLYSSCLVACGLYSCLVWPVVLSVSFPLPVSRPREERIKGREPRGTSTAWAAAEKRCRLLVNGPRRGPAGGACDGGGEGCGRRFKEKPGACRPAGGACDDGSGRRFKDAAGRMPPRRHWPAGAPRAYAYACMREHTRGRRDDACAPPRRRGGTHRARDVGPFESPNRWGEGRGSGGRTRLRRP